MTAAPQFLLTPGNSKLGPTIWCFNLPAVQTCPGKTDACVGCCYASRGLFVMPSNQRRHANLLALSRRDDFVRRLRAELQLLRPAVVRVHVSGDFYDAAYTQRWRKIAAAAPRTVFFAYTRSWRIAEIRAQLRRLAQLSNFHMWYSEDADSGPSPAAEDGARRAYMARNDVELAALPAGVDVAFRDHPRTVRKKIHGTQVCPAENGSDVKFTCGRCRICFTAARHQRHGDARQDAAHPGRRLLELAS